MKSETQIDYKLLDSFKYADKQSKQEIDADKIVLKAPSNLQIKQCMRIQKLVMGAIYDHTSRSTDSDKKSSDDTRSEEDNDFAASALMSLILSTDFDADSFIDNFKEVFCSGGQHPVCLINGSTPLNDYLYDFVSLRDMKNIMGEYVKNFLL